MRKREKIKMLKPIADAAKLKLQDYYAYRIIEQDGLYAMVGILLFSLSYDKNKCGCEFFFDMLFVPYIDDDICSSIDPSGLCKDEGYFTAECFIQRKEEIVRDFEAFYRKHSTMWKAYYEWVKFSNRCMMGKKLACSYFAAAMGEYDTARMWGENLIEEAMESIVIWPDALFLNDYRYMAEDLLRMLEEKSYGELREKLEGFQQKRIAALKLPEDWNEGWPKETNEEEKTSKNKGFWHILTGGRSN